MTAASNAELDQLIVQNLLDLDTAIKRLEQLGDEVWEQIRYEAEQWATAQAWGGDFDKNSELRFAPLNWETEGEQEAWFYFGAGPGDAGDSSGHWPYFWLTRYLGVGTGQMCLWLDQKVTGIKKWKAITRTSAASVIASGFHLSDAGHFYLPCSLNAEEVGAALGENDLARAMGPVREALDRAAQAKPTFDALIDQARQA